MKTRVAVLAVALGMLLFLTVASADAQVRIGFGIQVNAPLPLQVDVMVDSPFPGAVWVRGYWSWNDFAGRYVWVAGHWVCKHPQPFYRAGKVRHIPNGVAKGWWKKRGRQF